MLDAGTATVEASMTASTARLDIRIAFPVFGVY
jgi:hypothetical protein